MAWKLSVRRIYDNLRNLWHFLFWRAENGTFKSIALKNSQIISNRCRYWVIDHSIELNLIRLLNLDLNLKFLSERKEAVKVQFFDIQPKDCLTIFLFQATHAQAAENCIAKNRVSTITRSTIAARRQYTNVLSVRTKVSEKPLWKDTRYFVMAHLSKFKN